MEKLAISPEQVAMGAAARKQRQLMALIGIAASLVLAVACLMAIRLEFHYHGSPPYPGGYDSPVAALEFIRNPADLKIVLGDPPCKDQFQDPKSVENAKSNRALLQYTIDWDYIWIALYGILFLLNASLLAKRKCPLAVYSAVLGAVLAVTGAGLDVLENLRMTAALDASNVTQLMTSAIREAAILKWTFLFITLAVLSMTYSGMSRPVRWIGYLLTAAACIGFAGLWFPKLLSIFLLVLLAALILLIFLSFTRWKLFFETSY